MNRRGFIGAIAAGLAAPAICKAAALVGGADALADGVLLNWYKPPTLTWIEPVREAQAYLDARRAGFMSVAEVRALHWAWFDQSAEP